MNNPSNTTSKYGAVVSAVDPSQNLLQAITKTATNISVSVYVTPSIWRWPNVGDEIMIRQENGSWYFDGWFPDSGSLSNINDANVGDITLLSPTGQINVIGSPDGSTDFVLNKESLVMPTTLPPSGPAGGVLGGTYPNPSFAIDLTDQNVAEAANNTAQTVASSSNTYITTFSTFTANTAFCHAGSGGIEALSDGLYLFTCWMQSLTIGTSSAGLTNTYFSHQTASHTPIENKILQQMTNSLIAGVEFNTNGTAVFQMNATDIVTLGWNQNSGASMTMGTSNIIYGVRIA